MPAKLTRPENSFNNIYMRYYKKSFLFVKSYIHNEMVADYKTQNQLSQILLEVDELANGIFSYYQDNGDDLAHTDKIQILAKKYFNVLD